MTTLHLTEYSHADKSTWGEGPWTAEPDKIQWVALNQLLTDLWENDQVDALLFIKKAPPGAAVPFLAAKKRGKLGSPTLLADVKLHERLFDVLDKDGEVLEQGAASRSIDAMLGPQNRPLSEKTRQRYHVSIRQLRKLGVLKDDATVGALRDVDWPKAFAAWETSGANKNRLRAALSVFLSEFLGSVHHEFRREVIGRMPHYGERPRVPELEGAGVFWQLMEKVPDPARPCFITIAASGMRVGEYLQCTAADLRPARHAIHVPGGKTGEDEVSVDPELWEYVELAVPCRIAKTPATWRGVENDPRYRRLRKLLAKAGGELDPPVKVTIHDLRHLFAQLGVEEMPESMVQGAMRHKTPGMTRDYAMRKVKGEVARSVGQQLRRAK